MLHSVNLCLSSLCSARCVFCPQGRGRNAGLKTMPLALARLIIDELACPDFRREHPIDRLEVGENGDALLNPEFLPILRYIRERLGSSVRVELYTNMLNMTPPISQACLGERLVDSVTVNIDGHDAATYEAIKGIPFETVLTHLGGFLEARARVGRVTIPLAVVVMPMRHYARGLARLGVRPSRLPALPAKMKLSARAVYCDYQRVVAMLRSRFGDGFDIALSAVCAWAERGQFPGAIDCRGLSCPQIGRVEDEAFIAPDGTWYGCCLDADNEVAFGNVVEQSIRTVFASERRRQVIAMLREGRFAEIGGPCRTVNCCQILPTPDPFWVRVRRTVKRWIGRPR